MDKEEFLSRYIAEKVKFKSYYKDTFIFGGTGGKEITIWIAGADARSHILDIDADEEYLISTLSAMIHSAEIETEDKIIEIDFAQKAIVL